MSTNAFSHLISTLAASLILVMASTSPARAEDREPPPLAYAGLDSAGSTGSLPTPSPLGSVVPRARAPTRCLPAELKAVIADVAARFGSVSLESTYRGRGHNRRAGGAHRSLHLSCRAIDFRVRARSRGVMAYLRSRPEIGGLKVYRNGIIHIDNGARRSW